MKILHCCLASFYIDGYGYQENILPRVHKNQGHNVAIIASTETYVDNKSIGYVAPRSYFTEDEIPITRLPYASWLPHWLARKIRSYPGLYDSIESFGPDVIFLHDCQFLGVREVARYAKSHPGVRIYVDCHTDFVNSARTWISRHVLHGILYRYCAHLIEPHVRKFYGVSGARVDFLLEMYRTPPEKTELLLLGAEDSKIPRDRAADVRASIRHTLGIAADDLVIVTGGKIDRRKNIHVLMKVIDRASATDLKLIVFGTPDDDVEGEFSALAKSRSIRAVGWIESDRAYEYLLAGDLAVFPGTHSVLWEQAVGAGVPCVFRRWKGIEHVDVGGNCIFLERGDEDELERVLDSIRSDRSILERMRAVALDRGVREFSYDEIARRAIEA